MTFPSFVPGEVLRSQDMNAVGMWLVGSTTVTAQTTGVVDGCFSSEYRNYMMTVNVTGGTTNTELQAQFRVGTTPTATAYNWQAPGALGAAYNGDANASDTKFPVTFVPNPANNATSYFIGNPNVNVQTTFLGDWLYDDGGARILRRVGGRQQSTNQFTGIQVFTSAAWTGNIRIYGIRN